MLKKILIANRGEIACRIINTAKRLGLKTVAVYSDADKNALHVQVADEAYHIGPAPSKDSYLVSEKIIEIAKLSDADCIHPGYGFLSENCDFSRLCKDNSIVFIGPPETAIEAMGSKSRSKEIMAQANVPLVPGYYGHNQDEGFLFEQANNMGYPILIKAAFGGGGKGMRVVNETNEFMSALASAKREAIAGFGNDQVLLERYVSQPRHVEIQIFSDNHGNCIYLGDRDCSLQRRHQKVIEEAPAPALSDTLKKEMGEAAVRCAQAINYQGAGTVEFLLCEDEFFFMEMNTRLQVEHPVTEMITGVDLVEWQIRVASGQPLLMQQQDVTLTGHALEARIYAEDPTEDFMPCSGVIKLLSTPENSKHIRIDTGVKTGSEISSFYDPMIAKLIVWDENRDLAIKRLQSTLEQFHLAGFRSNIDFLHNLASHDGFVKTQPTTHFIGENQAELVIENIKDKKICVLLAGLIYLESIKNQNCTSPWNIQTGFRLNQNNTINIPFVDHSQFKAIVNDSGYILNLDGEEFIADIFISDHRLNANINGTKYSADHVSDNDQIELMYLSQSHLFQLRNKHYINEVENEDVSLAAPMNGTVVKHLLAIDSDVIKGDDIVVMEAMKMEYTLTAPFDGKLSSYCFEEGSLVSHGDLLAIVEPIEA